MFPLPNRFRDMGRTCPSELGRGNMPSRRGSQGGQVGYSPDFHSGGPGLTPAQGNQQKKFKKCFEEEEHVLGEGQVNLD